MDINTNPSTSANRSPSENCQFEYFEDSDDSCRDPDFIPSDHTSDEEIESVSLSASVAYETEMNSPREANERTVNQNAPEESNQVTRRENMTVTEGRKLSRKRKRQPET
ncbi:unnamed protein product [Acanthoscelides obtectus]|uniref:Uncharacterized protein n=1 Tax=Acanthoscelides obtectus TaxID=200917 RepID=A0A9P0Q2T7_ACAOB|nr:unnamed protein product [Acanthoscelides obtectus]CAK1641138.1 hypothetical protein AOBTE_LOCUS12187 [Acanthoscelides obtectus]